MTETTLEEITESPIRSARYEVMELIGRGTWGAVYSTRDTLLDRFVAIKVLDPNPVAHQQMLDRNVDALRVIQNEGDLLAGCANIVPRKLEVDENGKPFLVMPLYHTFLDQIIGEKDPQRLSVQNGLSYTRVMNYLCGIANGLCEIHTKLRRTHGDLKPDNIAIDNQTALIGDLGTSTFASFGRSVSPRDNMGCIYTRAP